MPPDPETAVCRHPACGEVIYRCHGDGGADPERCEYAGWVHLASDNHCCDTDTSKMAEPSPGPLPPGAAVMWGDDSRAHRLAETLQATIADLDRHIERRADEIAAGAIGAMRAAGAGALAEAHAEIERKDDRIATLRSILAERDSQLASVRAESRANAEAAAAATERERLRDA
jgi:ABC-type xylose transport system substrate-binding protein